MIEDVFSVLICDVTIDTRRTWNMYKAFYGVRPYAPDFFTGDMAGQSL